MSDEPMTVFCNGCRHVSEYTMPQPGHDAKCPECGMTARKNESYEKDGMKMTKEYKDMSTDKRFKGYAPVQVDRNGEEHLYLGTVHVWRGKSGITMHCPESGLECAVIVNSAMHHQITQMFERGTKTNRGEK